MKKQFGGAIAAVLITLGIIFSLALLVVMMFVGAGNRANGLEQQLKAQQDNNRNILAQYGLRVAEAAQVPDMAREDIIKVATAALEGRYGTDGSKAVFQMLTEQNPSVDPGLYAKLQQLIESGRNEFQTSQTRLLDIKRSYETALGEIPGGYFMRVMGYPKVNLADFKIVSSDRADKAFETGKDTPMQLRPAASSSK